MTFYYHYLLDCIADVGRVREKNQDSVLVLNLKDHFHDYSGSSALIVVADGVGGGPAGEVASKIAITAFCRKFVDLIMAGEKDRDIHEPFRHAFQHAHNEVISGSIKDPNNAGMATTLSAAYLEGPRCVIANVGDSRCYLIRAGRIRQLTKDHGKGNVLYQAIGAKLTLSTLTEEITVENNDTILVCSDGLSNMVPDPIIADTVVRSADPPQACSQLVQEANSRGGSDNVSVAMARVSVGFV